MAKRKAAATATAEPEPTEKKAEPVILTPQRVCELLGLPAPYDPPLATPPWPGCLTLWDPGHSVLDIRKRFRDLFYPMDWYEGAAFAKQTDMYKWRQFRLAPILPGKTFEEQSKKLSRGDEVAFGREVVTVLIVHFLTTGERLATGRLRCREILPSGRRVMIGPFSPLGMDLGSCADAYKSPGVGLSSVYTPPVKRK